MTMDVNNRFNRFSYENLFIADLVSILEFIKNKSEINNSLINEVIVYDKFSNKYSGNIANLDKNKKIIILHSNEDRIIYLGLESIISIEIPNASKIIKLLAIDSERNKSKSFTELTETNNLGIDLVQSIDDMQDAIKVNLGINTSIKIMPEDTLNTNDKENAISLANCIFSNLLEIGSDTFGKEVISSVKSFIISNSPDSKLSIRRVENDLIIKCDFSNKLPIDYKSIVSDKLNKLL